LPGRARGVGASEDHSLCVAARAPTDRMKGEIERSIHEASQAMERLLLSFERHIKGLDPSAANAEELQRLTKGIDAIRDSAGIYLTWARHYAKLLGEEEGEARLDLDSYLDEGGGMDGNQFFGP